LNAILRRFGRPRVLLPVVHCIDVEQTGRAIVAAMENGADGVFLINHGGLPAYRVVSVAGQAVRAGVAFVGVNLLGLPPTHALDGGNLAECGIHGLWTDDAGISDDCGSTDLAESDFDDMRSTCEWKGLYFGGVAFKYKAEVPREQWGAVAKRAARGLPGGAPAHHWVDVITTSGVATGSAPTVDKIAAMRGAIGDHALAIASGITPDNVEPFLPLCDAFLVASGIESSLGIFDPAKVRALADAIHAGGAA
jgi:hypothetical protein